MLRNVPRNQDLNNYAICLSPNCEVVYFGPHIFQKADVKTPVWYKETDQSIPVCYCKSVSSAQIIEHVLHRGCCNSLSDIQNHTGANTGGNCLDMNPGGT